MLQLNSFDFYLAIDHVDHVWKRRRQIDGDLDDNDINITNKLEKFINSSICKQIALKDKISIILTIENDRFYEFSCIKISNFTNDLIKRIY